MTKEETLKLIAPVIGYGVVCHSLDMVVETLEELDHDLAARVKAISDEIYTKFDEAVNILENSD